MSYTYYQAKNPTTININDEHVTETELPERLLELNRKTTAITYHPEEEECGAVLPALTEFSSSVHVNGEVTSDRLNNLYSNTVGITFDAFSRRTLISNIGKATITSFNDDKSVECFGALTATNVTSTNKTDIETLLNRTQAITYDSHTGVVTISGNTETSNLKVTYGIDTYTLSVGDGALFNGSVSFQSTVNGYNIDTELSKLQDMSVSDEETTISGTLRAGNLVGIAYDSNLNTTFFSGNLSSPNISALSMKLSGITYDEDLKTLIEGNRIGASNEDFGYTTDAPYIPVCKANGIMEIGYRLDFHLGDAVFRDFSAYISNTALNTLRIYGTTDDSGTLETNALHIRTSGDTVRVRMITNGYQNICVYNTAGTLLG